LLTSPRARKVTIEIVAKPKNEMLAQADGICLIIYLTIADPAEDANTAFS
jgi:hypothetical protein